MRIPVLVLPLLGISLACGSTQAPSASSPSSSVASSTAVIAPSAPPSAAIEYDAGSATPAEVTAPDRKALCGGQPPSCKPRLVDSAPFCGPTILWQMQQAGISPGDPRATQPVKACTCDHCASDGDCTDAPGGHCRELQADMDCVLPEKRCVYPKGPCAACPNACLHSGDTLTCSHRPPPP